jgi:hypothetical protein
MAAMCLIVLSIVFDWHVLGHHMAGVAGVVFFKVRALLALSAALTVPTQKHDVATRQWDANGADHERSHQKRCDFCADDHYLNRNQKRMQCIREDPIYCLLERFDVRKRMRKLRARRYCQTQQTDAWPDTPMRTAFHAHPEAWPDRIGLYSNRTDLEEDSH